MLVLGWLFVGWVAAAPRGLTDDTRRLPNGADLELGLVCGSSTLVAAVTAVVGRRLPGGGDRRGPPAASLGSPASARVRPGRS